MNQLTVKYLNKALHILLLFLFLYITETGVFIVSANSLELPGNTIDAATNPLDTTNTFTTNTNPLVTIKPFFPKTRLNSESAGKLIIKHPFDLKSPANIETIVVYDYRQNRYVFENRVGGNVISSPYFMSADEYKDFRRQQQQIDFFRERNSLSNNDTKAPAKFQLPSRDKKRDPLESLFGPGGVRVTTSGYIEVSTGFKRDLIDNPILPQRARKRTIFDFDQDINLKVNAKVGNKIDFNIKYDNEATFDMDAKQIRLAYRGDEDEIIKNIEAGNVSMTTTNSLIDGGAALFGVKADLQFGNLHINTVFSQQQSDRQRVTTSGGVHTIPFEINADEYDENRHFFLGHHFREAYDNALSKLPFVQSQISITRIEVWVTNKRGEYEEVRDIVALTDLGEYKEISNSQWMPQGQIDISYNRANTMYDQLISTYMGARNISEVANIFPSTMVSGMDYEKVENARLLGSNDYSYQSQLGYISLRVPLQDDEVLAVAFEFIYNGDVYQVGEFSNNIGRSGEGQYSGALFVKLLKPVSHSPVSKTWDLLMKNIYSLGYNVFDVQKDRFRLDINYLSDATGVYLNYLPEANDVDNQFLRMLNVDRLNGRGDPYPDGIFDFVDGYTIDAQNGFIIFPVVEPFGSHLRSKINNEAIADKYVFDELYDSTLTVARQIPEKNKFRLTGEYRGSSGAEINLNVMNIARGSVRATAAGVELTEGVDFIVDYMMGVVTIINRQLVDAGTPVSVTIENQSLFQTQRKTLMGVNLLYELSRNLSIGGTLMHYYEKPLIVKTRFGEEAAKNTLWGANLNYQRESYFLTNIIDKFPFVDAKEPSHIRAELEFAQMLPGHYKNKHTGGYSYLDDFEISTSGIDIRSPYSWSLASTPYNNSSAGMFPEASLSNNIDYGKNRAHLAWFYIDGLFTRRNSSLTPNHIKNDLEQLSDHRVRDVYEREVFPNRDSYYGLSTTIPTLNLSFYPTERGPYNLSTDVDSEGRLLNPGDKWGGIMRRIDTRDFEAINVEYIEFWLMDPFVNDSLGSSRGGNLYFNLGNISEDILKDGKKFFENGMPIDNDTSAIGYTVWGKYPKRQSTVYAFDNSGGNEARRIQDVGLNGLNSEEEKLFPTYSRYLDELKQRLSGEALTRMENDKHSPLNDPSGDNYRHYIGAGQDRQQLSILERYKYINGTEGNSLPADEDNFSSVSRTTPDVEDINNDNTMSDHESYYQYRVVLKPENMEVGSNYIVDKRDVSVRLRNGTDSRVTWYQFRIPIHEYENRIGSINGFNNIRFVRMFLTNFEEPVFLRFATLELVRSEWRNYRNDLISGGSISGSGTIDISAVNIEENGSRTPVNYVLPPGVTRIIDPGQHQLRQENEQSLSLKITDLEPGDSRSVYKNSSYDLRKFKYLQMFVHAESQDEAKSIVEDGDISVFLRLGSDYRNNYYEYEIPLRITPEGVYSTHSNGDRETVWPLENMFNFPLKLFTSLKLDRNNAEHMGSGADKFRRFSRSDPEKPDNSITIIGNPSLAEVKVMMIGVKNRSTDNISAEVWVNELRLSEFDEKGGWAAQANINLSLSDIGTINLSGRKETSGFGALDQGLLQRRNDDYSSFNLALNMELGRFLPKQAKVSAPLYYSFSNQRTKPMYDPFNQDILLSESIEHTANPLWRDSIQDIAITTWTNMSVSLSNVKMDIKSNKPMPYDPSNLSFSYSRNINEQRNPNTEYATVKDWRLLANYDYMPNINSWEPFKNIDLFKWVNFNPLPNSLSMSSDLARNYQEIQLRDLVENSHQRYLTFSRNFFWDRNFSLTWDISRNLKLSFKSGTLAEIEEPYLQVNKQINRNDYDVWKDSVVQSIKNLGRPLNYEQSADLTFTLPFSNIPFLSWINSSAAYNARYKWERGAFIEDESVGNYLHNELRVTLNNRFNPASLYDKIPVKNININLGFRKRTDLPGYSPVIGDLFGQHTSPGGLLPGLGFAFGMDGGLSFIEKSLANNLLVMNEENITYALLNETKNLRIESSIVPFAGLTINLNMLYEDNRRTEVRYMIEGVPKIRGGSFSMSTIMASSAFENSKSDNDYHSETFIKFRESRDIIAERVMDIYANFPEGVINRNSADVLIPAFLSAYTGRNPQKIELTAFPVINSILPNWDISYNIVTTFPELRNYLKSINLNHRYVSQYRVGSYSSYLGWVQLSDDNNKDVGYVLDPVTGNLNVTSPFDISSVSLMESFNPLIEIHTLLNNDLSFNLRLNKTRSLNLNLTSYQIVELNDNDIVLGMGYRNKSIFSAQLDVTQKNTQVLIRNIESGFTQATSGLRTTTIRFSSDYALSKRLILKAYYDRVVNRPLVSAFTYPTTDSSAGLSLRFKLDQ